MNTEKTPPELPELKIPEVKGEAHRRQLKLMLFDAKKSAALTVWLVAVPCFFLFAVFMKYSLRVDLRIFTIIEEFMASIDKSSGVPMMSALLLVGLPLVAVAVNVLSLLHITIDHEQNELVATIKLRWLNITLTIVCLGVIGIFLAYAILENIHHHYAGLVQ
jgi:lantibiotic transport system permease protein